MFDVGNLHQMSPRMRLILNLLTVHLVDDMGCVQPMEYMGEDLVSTSVRELRMQEEHFWEHILYMVVVVHSILGLEAFLDEMVHVMLAGKWKRELVLIRVVAPVYKPVMA